MKINNLLIKKGGKILSRRISIKVNFISILFLFISFVFINRINSQPLPELINIAIENNAELKSLEKAHLAALEKAPQVSQMPDPEIGIGGFPLPVETRLGAQYLRLSASQMLPWKGVLDGRKELEIAKAAPLKEQVSARQLEIEYAIKQAYFQLYEINVSLNIIQRNLTIFESLERLALAKVESGKATLADVLAVQIKIEELKQQLEILEISKKIPTANINHFINRDATTPIAILDNLLFAELPYQKEELIKGATASHPALKMFELQQLASQEVIELNNLNRKPGFGVGADYIMVSPRDDANPTGNGRDILQFRGVVKIPLYKNQYEAKEQEEQIKIEAIEDRKNNLRSVYAAEIEKAFASHEIANLKIELYERQKEMTLSAVRVLEAGYSVAENNFSELLRLEKELVELDFQILKAIVSSHMAKSNLERFVF